MPIKLNITARILVAFLLALAIPHNLTAAGPAPLDLRSTASFSILAGAAITTTGGGTINGDVGASPIAGSAIGVTCALVNGTIYAVDASGPPCAVIDPAYLTTVKGDLTIAFNDAAGRTPIPSGPNLNPGSGNIGGMSLAPGLYKFTSTAQITGADLTLVGGPDDVWIFQCAQDLQLGSGIKVILSGGARAKNIFWQVGTSAVLGTSSVFKGTILANQAITMNTSSTIEGRALAFSAGVTFNGVGSSLPVDPIMAVQQPTGINLTNGVDTNHFGNVVIGTNSNHTFLITNSGNANLTGLLLTIDGTDAALFSVTTNPIAPISPNGTTTFTIRFAPLSSGPKSATLHLVNNDPSSSPFNVNLDGSGLGNGPGMAVQQPLGIDLINGVSTNDFGFLPIGTNTSHTFTITNTGSVDLTGLNITIDGTDAALFSVTTNPAASVPANGSSDFTVRFAPLTSGVKTAVLHLENSDTNNNPFNINLTGAGSVVTTIEMAVQQPVGVNLINNANTNDFGSRLIGTSAALTFTITNPGSVNITGLGITIDGPDAALFSVTTNPVAPVVPNGSTTFTVRFEPISGGVKTAALHIANNNPNSNPFNLYLTGTATAVPAAMIAVQQQAGTNLVSGANTNNFGSLVIGTNASLTFLITNSGGADLTGLNIIINGTDAALFSITTNPVAPVSPNGSTTFSVRFTPLTPGVKSAALHIASNDTNNNPFTLYLTGTATIPAPVIVVQQPLGTNLVNSANTNSFGSLLYGSNTFLTFVITNSGSSNLTGLGITIDGTNAALFSVTTNPVAPVIPGGRTTFTVRFAPLSAGVKTAALHIANNDTNNNPFTLYLTGTGTNDSTNLFTVGASPIKLNPQTGLFEQTVHLTNVSATNITGVRLFIQNLPSDVQVYNASGKTNGLPYLQYNLTIGSGAGIDFLIEYYRANRLTIPQPGFLVQVIATPSTTASGAAWTVDRFVPMAGGRFLLEFTAVPGNRYAVQYTSDLTAAWKTADPVITAPANRVQWYDDGPPKTESKPTTGSRFYRIVALP